MVDIIPAAVLATVSETAREGMAAHYNQESEENQMPPSGSSGIEVMPEFGPTNPQNNKRGAWISIITVILVVVIGGIIIFINRENVSRVFTGNSGVSTSGDQQASYASIDEDNDGLTTLEELASGTLVLDPDTDKDGLPDGFEIKNGLNPLDSLDSAGDEDSDDLNNADEYYYETKLNDPDTDKDGFKDGAEVKGGFNPNGQGALVQKISDEPAEPVLDNSVSITSENFNPRFLRIKEGDSLTFVNEDTISHSITGPEIETGNILPGKSFTLEFPNEGTFEFFDKDNVTYTGKVIVEKGSAR